MKKVKKVAALLLSLAMLFSHTDCQSNSEENMSEVSKTNTSGISDEDTPEATDTNISEASDTNKSENTKLATDASETALTANNINVCIASEPETLDPNLEESVDGDTYVLHMFEGLMKHVSTGETAGDDQELYNTKISYGQAESFEVSENNEGQVVYTFTLRDDIYWSDGEPVVAKDFEYSWKRVVDPDTAAAYGYILNGIVAGASEIQAGEADPDELGVAALDDRTLQITLKVDCPYFIDLCAAATFVPLRQDIIQEYGTAWTEPENCISNGAFNIDEWVHESYIRMTPNEYYYDAMSITPDSITWWLSNSQTAMMSAYESDVYDFLDKGGIPTDRIADLKENGDFFSAPSIGTYFIYINCDIVTDWRVRAALTLAIDREYLVENVTQGGQTAAVGFVPGGITNSQGDDWVDAYGSVLYEALKTLYLDYDLSDYAGRCELAQALYQEAVEEGAWDANTTISYLLSTSDIHQKIAEAIQSDWQSVLGVSCTLSNQDWNVYANSLAEGNFSTARMGWTATYDDATIYLEMFTKGNDYNLSDWNNDEYTAMLEKAKSLGNSAQRDKVMSDAQKLLFGEDGFPIAPIYFYTTYYCRTLSLKNVEYTVFGCYFFHHATIEE